MEDLWFNLYQDQGQKKNNEVEAIGDKVYRIRENKMLGLKLEAQRKRRFLRNAPEADSDVLDKLSDIGGPSFVDDDMSLDT